MTYFYRTRKKSNVLETKDINSLLYLIKAWTTLECNLNWIELKYIERNLNWTKFNFNSTGLNSTIGLRFN
jgi:hypothetical protein